MSKPGKVGRPALPKKEKRGRFISTRLSSVEYAQVEAAIRASGEPKTEWIRKKILAAARRAQRKGAGKGETRDRYKAIVSLNDKSFTNIRL